MESLCIQVDTHFNILFFLQPNWTYSESTRDSDKTGISNKAFAQLGQEKAIKSLVPITQ